MEEGRTALPALCASCTGCLLEARYTGPHACWGIGFILLLKWRVFIYLILYVTHLIVNGLRTTEVQFQSRASAIAFMLPSDWFISTSFSYIYWCHPHRWRQQRLHNSSTCLLLLLFRSNILTRGLIRTIIISFVRAFHTKCFLIFPCKVSASGILKGSRYTLSLRFFQKVLGQVCLIPKSFKPWRMK